MHLALSLRLFPVSRMPTSEREMPRSEPASSTSQVSCQWLCHQASVPTLFLLGLQSCQGAPLVHVKPEAESERVQVVGLEGCRRGVIDAVSVSDMIQHATWRPRKPIVVGRLVLPCRFQPRSARLPCPNGSNRASSRLFGPVGIVQARLLARIVPHRISPSAR